MTGTSLSPRHRGHLLRSRLGKQQPQPNSDKTAMGALRKPSAPSVLDDQLSEPTRRLPGCSLADEGRAAAL
jgi:hypothetical protein